MNDCDTLLAHATVPTRDTLAYIKKAHADTGASIHIFEQDGRPMCGIVSKYMDAPTVILRLGKASPAAPYEVFRDAVQCVAAKEV